MESLAIFVEITAFGSILSVVIAPSAIFPVVTFRFAILFVVTFAGANDVAITTDATTDTLTVGLPTYDAGLLYGTLPQGIGYKTVFFGLNVVNGVLQVTDSNNSSATFKPTDYMDSFLAGPDTTFAIDSLGHLQITLT